jgi:hypothetical protein
MMAQFVGQVKPDFACPRAGGRIPAAALKLGKILRAAMILIAGLVMVLWRQQQAGKIARETNALRARSPGCKRIAKIFPISPDRPAACERNFPSRWFNFRAWANPKRF